MKSFILIVLVTLASQAFGNICGRSESGTKIFPGDCTRFIICNHGYDNFLECPEGLYFNGNECRHHSEVPDCVNGVRGTASGESGEPEPEPIVPPGGPQPEPEVPAPQEPEPEVPAPEEPVPEVPVNNGECPANAPFYYLPFPSDCNRFYVCQNGVLKGSSNCQADLVFRPSIQACVVPTGPGC